MFIEAIDLVLQRLKEGGVDFAHVKGISGAGMQHGTVFWSHDAENIMRSLDPSKTLLEQLEGGAKGERRGAFSHPFSPNWQDASTQKQCEQFDKALGSPEKLAEATGSSAHHVCFSADLLSSFKLTVSLQRFSGPQIMKFRQKHPEAYKATSRISLVSSFLASVFLGKVASIDISDVGGMNLWDIQNKKWHDDLLALAAGDGGAEDLRSKLGPLAQDGGASFGPISPYFVSRYGFHESCCIIPMTGDNPSTILALPLHASDAIVSLGTSTTFLMSTPQYKPDPSYHFMSHPTTPGLYMFMLCYKNGSLAREQVRDAVNAKESQDKNSKDWETYNRVATASPVLGQSDPSKGPARMGLFFPRPEIVPNVKAGTWRFLYDEASKSLTPVQPGDAKWPEPDADARAILESQYLSLRLRSQALVTPQKSASGAPLPPQPRRVYLVGGGSANAAFADLAGQVLGGAEGVFKLDIGGNACALGGAYKACWGVERAPGETFEDFLDKRWNEEEFVKRVAEGYREGIWEQYGKALEGFDQMEKLVLKEAGAEGA